MTTKTNFLKIDPLRLDQEWLKQPELYYEFAVQLADARRELEDARNECELVHAELDEKVRTRPDRYGLTDKRLTETAIRSAVLKLERYKTAQNRQRDARHAVDIVQAAVIALDHRKRALSDLVTLHGQNYFSSPEVTKNPKLKRVAEESIKSNVRKIGQYRVELDDDDDTDQ